MSLTLHSLNTSLYRVFLPQRLTQRRGVSQGYLKQMLPDLDMKESVESIPKRTRQDDINQDITQPQNIAIRSTPDQNNIPSTKSSRKNNNHNPRKQKYSQVEWENTYKSRKQQSNQASLPNSSTNSENIDSNGAIVDADTDSMAKKPRLGPKRKMAVLIGFCGTGYQGMQINPGATTIESELFKALVNAKAVSEDNAEDQKKVGFMRAARTDKGVHAVGQVINAKLVLDHLKDPVAEINAYLPDQIRIWDMVRVTSGFHSKQNCDGRIYEYILPTYVFEPDTTFHQRSADLTATINSSDGNNQEEFAPLDAASLSVNRDYRITNEQMTSLRAILRGYQGTHNYHNFTVGKKPTEMSSKRYIVKFGASDPEIYSYKNEAGRQIQVGEWVSLKVTGQSFMLHQIRKMVGLAILLIKTNTPIELQSQLFTHTKVNIPKAPGIGLLLEQCLFTIYNKKIETQTGRQPINFDQHMDKINAFKRAFVYDRIVAEEHIQKCFQVWLELILRHPYRFDYLTMDGKLPVHYQMHESNNSNVDPTALLDGESDEDKGLGDDE